MFRHLIRSFCTSQLKSSAFERSKEISAGIAGRVKKESRFEQSLPKIFRGKTPVADGMFGDVRKEWSDLFEQVTGKEENVDDKVLMPYGIPGVFDAVTRKSNSFEKKNPYGAGASVYIEPFVNIRHGVAYYKLLEESTVLPEGLVLVQDRQDKQDCHRIITNNAEMTVSTFCEKLSEIEEDKKVWRLELDVMPISDKVIEDGREILRKMKLSPYIPLSAITQDNEDEAQTIMIIAAADILSTENVSEPPHYTEMTLQASKDTAFLTLVSAIVQIAKTNPEWFEKFLDLNSSYFDAKFRENLVEYIPPMTCTTSARRDDLAADLYCKLQVGECLLATLEELYKNGDRKLTATLPADTPENIVSLLEIDTNWRSTMKAIHNKQWLSYTLSFLCFEDHVIDSESYCDRNEWRFVDKKDKYDKLLTKFQNALSTDSGKVLKRRLYFSQGSSKFGAIYYVNNKFVDQNERTVNIRHILDKIANNSQLEEKDRELMYSGIERAMYLDLFARAIFKMDEAKDVYDVDFDKIFDNNDIELLNQSLIDGFEKYAVRLINARHLGVSKYKFDLDDVCLKVMTDLLSRMKIHMFELGYEMKY